MARHFTAQCVKNGYAAMGGSLRRPVYSKAVSGSSVAEAIAAERRKAARIAAATKKK
jgi:hypothetical protein